jgi:hypothetical protein
VYSTWLLPVQRVNAIALPFGDQIGHTSATGEFVTRRTGPPFVVVV